MFTILSNLSFFVQIFLIYSNMQHITNTKITDIIAIAIKYGSLINLSTGISVFHKYFLKRICSCIKYTPRVSGEIFIIILYIILFLIFMFLNSIKYETAHIIIHIEV